MGLNALSWARAGGVGYFMCKTGFKAVPPIFAMIIGFVMESNFRQALLSSQGSFGIFFAHPISAILISVGILIILIPIFPRMRGRTRVLESDV